jgi:predicted glycosyltransferase
MGELARMLTLARAAVRQWPDVRVHLIVNRGLPPAARARIPAELDTTLLRTSPTLDDDGVCAALDRCRPALVLFDNAGTARQCRHAHRLGARTVFISTRARTRRRGTALDWLPWLDEHWVVGPARLERLTGWQRLKTTTAGVVVRRLQSIFPTTAGERRGRVHGVTASAPRPSICFVPGGGGGRIDGAPAVTVFADAAAAVARRATIDCTLLQGPLYDGPPIVRPGVQVRAASDVQMVEAIRGAHLVVVGASSTLFQALAQRRVCVATSAGGGEQLARARRWEARGVVRAADPTAAAMAAAVLDLLARPQARAAIARRIADLGVTNDLPVALAAIRNLLDRPSPR